MFPHLFFCGRKKGRCATSFADRNYFAFFHLIRRYGQLAFSDHDVSVRNHLTRLGTALCQTKTIDHIVEAPFEALKEMFYGRPGCFIACFFDVASELFLGKAVDIAQFLFFLQLNTVFGKIAPVFAFGKGLAGRRRPLFKNTFRGKTFLTFQEKFFSGTTASFAFLVRHTSFIQVKMSNKTEYRASSKVHCVVRFVRSVFCSWSILNYLRKK